jgi:PAS domain S-box-containing protein
MATQLNTRFASSLTLFSRYMGVAIVALGVMVLFGWMFNIAVLKSVIPGLATMKANAALAFVFAGSALFLNSYHQLSHRTFIIARWLALIVILISVLTLFEHWFGWDLGIDQLLFQDIRVIPAAHPGRMSLVTAVDFLLIGSALFLLDIETKRGYCPFQTLALVAGLLAFLAVIGYFYGAGPYVPMALHSSLSFTLFSLAIFCVRPERGLMRTFLSDAAGGVSLRRLLPVALIMPIVLGWLRLWGERMELYDTTFGVVLLVLSTMILLGITIWLNAGMLNASDANRQQAEERFRLVVEAAPTAMVMVNVRGKIQIANIHAREMFGYQLQELIGKSVDLLVPERFRTKHAGFRQDYFADPQARLMGVGRDLFGVRKDGQEFPIEIGLSPVQTPGEIFVLAAIIDITQRKKIEAEMKQSIEDLARSNKELEQFAYVASHDLQEPLRMVSSYVQLLARRYQGKLDSDADDFIGFAVEGAGRMKVLINDLLTFSRIGTRGGELTPVMLEDVFNRVVRTLDLTIEENKAVITHDALPQVMADQGQMLQLFQNLIGNALKFRSDKPPKVHVGVRREEDQWLFYVRDNGIGIDPQFWERIFIIFQRLHTREEYQGTGIGLAICRKIIERHGGRIWVESEVDKGSTFYFTLTPVDEAVLASQDVPTGKGKASRRDTVADRADDLV